MDTETQLKQLGLDEKESKIYLALLKNGQSTMTEIARDTEIKRPTAYLAIESLQNQGLVSETKIDKRKRYSAAHPLKLVELLDTRKKSLETSLPQLLDLYNKSKDKPLIQIFEKKAGLKLVYKDVFHSIKNGSEALFFANVEGIFNNFPEIIDYFKDSIAKLKKVSIREIHYDNSATTKWAQSFDREYQKGYQIRRLKPNFPFGLCDNVIYDNKLVIFSLSGPLFAIVIEDGEIAKTYRAIFEWLWQVSAT